MPSADADRPADSPVDDVSRRLVPLLRPLVDVRSLVALSVIALSFGLAEAFVLVLLARIAFAMSKGLDTIGAEVGGLERSLTIGQALLAASAIVAVRGALQVANGWQSTRLVTATQARTRRRLAGAFVRTSWERQSQERSGRLQELLTTFVASAANVVDSLAKGITSVFSLIALLGTAVVVSPVAALGLIAALGVLGLTLQPLRRVIRSASRRVVDTNVEFATGISEISGLGREVQVFGVEGPTLDRIERLIEDNARASRRQAFLGFLFAPLYATVMLLLVVAALAVVWVTGLSDLEELSAIMLVMLRSLAYGQLAQGVYGNLQASTSYLGDLRDQLQAYETDEVDRSGVTSIGPGPIVGREVSYSYGRGSFALDAISFSIEPGEVVGMIGPSGSGKSTLVQLLLRLRAPSAGVITVGGVALDAIALDEWRARTSFVPQEARLINGTVADNIRFYRDLGLDEVEQAARLAHIHDEVLALPSGYDTDLGAAEVHLSGGQQQRICIARALATSPSLLVLDEPTSALDVLSESRIRETLSDLRGSVSTIIVAHRLSTVEICDRIMVLSDGKVTGFDNPEALRRSSAFYREALQLSGLR